MTPKRLLLPAVLAGTLALPAGAGAIEPPACDHDPVSRTLAIRLFDSSAHGVLARGAGGAIRFKGLACDGATVTNTDTIALTDMTGASIAPVIALDGGPFAPGATAEPGTDEIEITADLGPGGTDHVVLTGSPAGSTVFAGTAGVDLNAGEEGVGAPDADADLQLTGVEQLEYESREGTPGDTVLATGGQQTGAPLPIPFVFLGESGDDVAFGGSGPDLLLGGEGEDTLNGGAGDDHVEGQLGDDLLAGGVGRDTAELSAATGGVHADLAAGKATGGTGTDALVGFEDLVGSPYADVLAGTEGPNALDGGGGTDVVSYAATKSPVIADLATGVAGTDTLTDVEGLVGSSFADTLRGDGAGNALRGGAGADTLEGRGGADVLDCDAADHRVLDALDTVLPCPAAPAPAPAPAATPVPSRPAAPAPVVLRARAIRRTRSVRVVLRASADLRARVTVTARSHRVGARRAALRAGRRAVVRVPVRRSARRAALRIRVRGVDAAGHAAVRRLRVPRR